MHELSEHRTITRQAGGPMNYSSLNFALGETIDMLREQVQAFVAAELAPRAEAIDQDNLFPADMWKK
ncbi:acyl-CoA dehydrogenase family protein, partial [Citrobacter sp. VF227]